MLQPVSPCPLKFSDRTQLVTMEAARFIRGVSAEAVLEQVESGKLLFVWDVSAKARSRVCEWRFWLRELMDPGAVANLSKRSAIALMLGEHRTQWRGTELGQMLLLSRPSIHRLHKCQALSGKVKGNTLWVARAALEKFLLDRFIGSSR